MATAKACYRKLRHYKYQMSKTTRWTKDGTPGPGRLDL